MRTKQIIGLRLLVIVALVFAMTPRSHAQTLDERIKHAKAKLAASKRAEQARKTQLAQAKQTKKPTREDRRSAPAKMGDVVDPVDLDSVSAKRTLDWWARSTGIPVIVNWNALENEGVDTEKLITIKLRRVPAGKLLSMIMRQMSDDITLMYQVTPWYVRVMTKEQANRMTVLRIYDIADLLHEVPDFDQAPEFDLNSALQNTNSGGSNGNRGGNNQQSPFGSSGSGGKEDGKSRAERGEEIAELIRDSVEPDLWQANGGEHASIKYFNGQLIVKAPLYVQQQIGIPSVAVGRGSDPGKLYVSPGKGGVANARPPQRAAPGKPRPVAGVAKDP